VNSSPVGKVIRSSTVSVIMELQVPSNKQSLIGVIDFFDFDFDFRYKE
jgi:hypothetical protein